MSLGFLIEFLIINAKLDKEDDIHREEKQYNQMKSILPDVEEKHDIGVISDIRYKKWMERFTELEEKYG